MGEDKDKGDDKDIYKYKEYYSANGRAGISPLEHQHLNDSSHRLVLETWSLPRAFWATRSKKMTIPVFIILFSLMFFSFTMMTGESVREVPNGGVRHLLHGR